MAGQGWRPLPQFMTLAGRLWASAVCVRDGEEMEMRPFISVSVGNGDGATSIEDKLRTARLRRLDRQLMRPRTTPSSCRYGQSLKDFLAEQHSHDNDTDKGGDGGSDGDAARDGDDDWDGNWDGEWDNAGHDVDGVGDLDSDDDPDGWGGEANPAELVAAFRETGLSERSAYLAVARSFLVG